MKSYKATMNGCFIGYAVQAIVNNFAPLLFLTFQSTYGIPLAKITVLITVNFILQLTVDIVSVFVIDKIGYKRAMIAAHIFCAGGFILMTVLNYIIGNKRESMHMEVPEVEKLQGLLSWEVCVRWGICPFLSRDIMNLAM